jgi:beta-lactamase superfamily II metal-dependent hydrolase
MRIEIFDVGHGQCACVTTPNGRRILIDCGDRREPYWWPSIHFYGQPIDALVVTNLDEDHLTDFANLRRNAPPQLIVTNRSVGAAQLAAMKPDGMGTGTRAFHEWLLWQARTPGAAALFPLPDFGGVRVESFCNSYGAFTNTNNLSLVTFVSFAGFSIVFTGDMECDGWAHLLATQPLVRQPLANVNVFVTSHHGRESGCSDDVCAICKPQLFVISDGVIEHETQETTAWYRDRADGAQVTRRQPAYAGLLAAFLQQTEEQPPTRRFVVSTRSDKSIQIDVTPNVAWTCEVGIDHTRT